MIAELAVGRGCVGMTICPGKKGKSTFGIPWDRDLETDLDAVRVWGASTLITLMEQHELEQLKVQDLGKRVLARGLKWLHLPIVDLRAPNQAFRSAWPSISCSLHDRLAKGEKILIHCRGGLGRTGLVAAMLLIEHGFEFRAAISAVRNARPGAIETFVQQEYLANFRP